MIDCGSPITKDCILQPWSHSGIYEGWGIGVWDGVLLHVGAVAESAQRGWLSHFPAIHRCGLHTLRPSSATWLATGSKLCVVCTAPLQNLQKPKATT